MKFTTAITEVKEQGTEEVRGKELTQLIQHLSFVQTIGLVLFARDITKEEERMLNAMFTAVIDHGPGTTSALIARISASAKNPTHASLAAGILGFGERHGVAISPAMRFFYDHADTADLSGLLAEMKSQKKYVSGYGHKILRDVDPRAETLFAMAKEQGIFGTYCTFAHDVHKELNKQSSKTLPINIDGAIAAILCDMGISSQLGDVIFLIGRVPGLLAHILEEQASGEGIRRLAADEVHYQQ